jgi:hypothetical protein
VQLGEFGTNFDIIRHPETHHWVIAVGFGPPVLIPLSISPPDGALYYNMLTGEFFTFHSTPAPGSWSHPALVEDTTLLAFFLAG